MPVYADAASGYRDTTKWLTAFLPITAIATAGLTARRHPGRAGPRGVRRGTIHQRFTDIAHLRAAAFDDRPR